MKTVASKHRWYKQKLIDDVAFLMPTNYSYYCDTPVKSVSLFRIEIVLIFSPKTCLSFAVLLIMRPENHANEENVNSKLKHEALSYRNKQFYDKYLFIKRIHAWLCSFKSLDKITWRHLVFVFRSDTKLKSITLSIWGMKFS